ncbi:hypothetical protein CDO52_00305 [Nocardiopsis gilva YIM 90087]|uniref:Uncharacterized protein n=1 Tax=Nocardiopsis gilva YIM 90087 TaxID=1235441 RepID=A0A223RZW2_9ACTN|nr:hypothetical protein [Nocardiopsis gilva]ASU81388.1 hypothetical protein CDO52_00075 [Nocardiopsis gilva YIM 90087]ASU81425.1 hypothetical protein CDO52_00305 [Nocardiopsis gilva YIM 90087]
MHSRKSSPLWEPIALNQALDDLKELGYTRDRLAKVARVHRSQVSRWAHGLHRPNHDAVDHLVEQLLSEDSRTEVRDAVLAFAAAAGYRKNVEPEASPPSSEREAAASLQDARSRDGEELVNVQSDQEHGVETHRYLVADEDFEIVQRVYRSIADDLEEDDDLPREQRRALLEHALERARDDALMMLHMRREQRRRKQRREQQDDSP